MRYNVFLPLLFVLACNQPAGNTRHLQSEIDSLQQQIAHAYKPGFGEFMSGIQVHHAKLWFAGTAENWPLAQFEIDEIKESIEDIKTYCTDRKETTSLLMIDAPLDSVAAAIKTNDATLFKNSFTALTSACNNCHQATRHEFNVIKLPEAPPFSNQEFKVR